MWIKSPEHRPHPGPAPRQAAGGGRLPGRARAIAAAAVVACAPAVWAADIDVGIGQAHYDNEERLPDGRRFNHESGDLERQVLRVGAPALGMQWQLWAAEDSGELRYDGQTQLGIPLHTTTRLHQSSMALWLRQPLTTATERWETSVLAGIELRRQVRAIQPTAHTVDLTETTQSRLAQLGIAAAVRLPLTAGRWQLAGQVTVFRPWHQRLQVRSDDLFAPLTLTPAHHTGTSSEWTLTWQTTPTLSLAWSLGWRRWRVGAADEVIAWDGTVPVGLVSFPGNHQRQIDRTFCIRLAF